MECYEDSNRLFVNPGSATGAFSPFWIPSAPSSQPAEQPAASSDEGVPATAGNEEGEAGSKVNGDETSPKRSDGDSKDPTGEPTADKGEPTDEQSKPLSPSQPPTSSNSTYPPEPTPTFALLDIQGTVIVTYIYQLVAGEVKVDKFEFRRVG
jgi:vacuolar protein sorting-associated protein 29